MTQGTHHSADDPRNRDILIYVNGELHPRDQAVVSVFDSGFILGDGVWEGLRVHHGRIAFLEMHLARLFEAAKAIDLDIGMERAALTAALYRTLAANQHDRWGARAPHGDPRHEEHPVPGSARLRRARHRGDHSGIQAAETRGADPRGAAVHRARAARRTGRAGPEAQFAFQAQLHHRLHPGHQGRCGRGPDARPARLRRHLQFHPFLHRAPRGSVDVHRQVLPRRHHARQRAADLPRGGYPGASRRTSA